MEDFIRKVNGEAKMVRKKLNENRLAKGMTIENLSEKTGIPIGTLSKICSGHTNTSFDNIALIANALQCSMDEFSEFSGPATLEWEMNWVEKYRDLSEHGKRMIDRLMDLDIHLSKQVEDAKERLLCVWVPVTYMEDGMNYDTCHIRYLNVRDSVSLKDVDFGYLVSKIAERDEVNKFKDFMKLITGFIELFKGNNFSVDISLSYTICNVSKVVPS